MASDGFFFDVEKWFGSIAAQRMSFADKGVYLTMLFQQWREPSKSLPDDPRAVADRIAITDGQVAEVLAAWPSVRSKFEAVERAPGQIQNRVVEKTRRKQAENRRKRVEAGRVGGKVSAAKRKTERELDGKHRLSIAQAKPSDQIREEKRRVDQSTPLPPGLERRTIPERRGGGRIFLHRWQLDELIDALGPHAATFELDSWIDGLTAEADAQGLTFPTKESRWEWVRAQLTAAIAKRGLPVASAASVVAVVKPRGCRHVPPCADDAAHTKRDMAERRQVPA